MPLRLRRFATLACAAMFAATALPAAAAPGNQVGPAAPENLRCPGNPPPPLPGPGWRIEPVWEWRDVIHVEGVVGTNDGPYAVAVDRNCNIYLADAQHYQVIKMNKDGDVTARWTLPPGERPPGESSSGRGVAVDKSGNVYVTDTTRDRVFKLSPQGQVVAAWGVCETPTEANRYCDHKQPGMFTGPEGIAVDGADNLYVAEASGGRIQKLSTEGQPRAIWDLSKIGALLIPGSLSIDQGGFVYLAEGFNDVVVKFDPNNGNIVGRWGGEKSGQPGQFHTPLGVGVDGGGNVYVADAQNWRVQKLAADGAFLDQWRLCLDGDPPCELPDAGQEPGQFMYARGIALDGQGTVYVADTANKRLQRLMIVDFILIPPPPPEDDAE